MTRLLTDTPVTSDEEQAVITRSSTFPRLCVASVTFCLKLASDRTSRRALACGSLSSPYLTLKSPTMMMPDFVPTHLRWFKLRSMQFCEFMHLQVGSRWLYTIHCA